MEQFSFHLSNVLLNHPFKEAILRSPVQLIAQGMEILNTSSQWAGMTGTQKKEVLVGALEKIAKGSDGVEGTADDLFPPEFVATVKLLLERQLVSQIVDVISAAAKGKWDVAKAQQAAKDTVSVAKGCFPIVAKLFRKKRV